MRKVVRMFKGLVVVVALTLVLDATGYLPAVLQPAVHAVERRASQQVEHWWDGGAPARVAGAQMQALAQRALARMDGQRARWLNELGDRYAAWWEGEEQSRCR